MKKDIDLFQTPKVVSKLGDDVFVKVPVFKADIPHTPIYINNKLYNKFFSANKNESWQTMSETISNHFSFTINNTNANSGKTNNPIGWAYVDKQACPLDLSLSGNLGSGRAYYVGKYFNIKGEKTPLATSTDPYHSDGCLAIKDAIWETVVANALSDNSKIMASPILAILVLEQDNKTKKDRAIIIRVTDTCLLDRLTHVFYLNKPLAKSKLINIANNFGKLEGNKFIERIIHGCWSPGNISTAGDLIDLQSVCSVFGRNPQFSSAMSYHENYFGYEYNGQALILKALTEDQQINTDEVKYELLAKCLVTSMNLQIAKEFVHLMGFSSSDKVFKLYKREITELASKFSELSRKCYPLIKGFFSCEPYSLVSNLFDFSAFFRAYPLLKRLGGFNSETALQLVYNKNIKEDEFYSSNDNNLADEVLEDLHKNVHSKFNEHFIVGKQCLDDLHEKVLEFTNDYDQLFTKILTTSQVDPYTIEARAYVINEDRLYMSPMFSLSNWLAENPSGYSNEHIDIMINLLVQSCNRRASKRFEGKYIADIEIYLEGYSYVLLNGKGQYNLCITLFNKNITIDNLDKYKFKLFYLDHELQVDVNFSKYAVIVISNNIDNDMLLHENSAYNLFSPRNFLLTYESQEICLTPLHIRDISKLLQCKVAL